MQRTRRPLLLTALVVTTLLACGTSTFDGSARDPGESGAGAGGASSGGRGGAEKDASIFDQGHAGVAGASGATGRGGTNSGGAAGTSTGGTAGTGSGGIAGSGGSAGSGARGGSAGVSGSAGAGGSAGAAGGGGSRADAAVDSARDTSADQRGTEPDVALDTANDTGADGKPPGPPLVPTAGALLGVFFGAESVSATETMLGREVAVRLTYYAWNDDWTRGNTSSDLAAGRIPLVNWEPHTPTLDDIISGVYDSMLHMRAAGAKALGKPFFLDWGAEMNGNWAPWDGSHNGMSSAKYIAAYRHIHDIFVADGATNVVWAWCPNVTDEPRAAWNETLGYYPGDDYVDWTCVDGYNWGSTGGGGWQSFQQVFSAVYAKLATKGKPILIGEMASTEEGGDKAQWIAAMVPALKNNFPLIKGLVWFDINKETDWRIASSTPARDAFITMANDPYMNP